MVFLLFRYLPEMILKTRNGVCTKWVCSFWIRQNKWIRKPGVALVWNHQFYNSKSLCMCQKLLLNAETSHSMAFLLNKIFSFENECTKNSENTFSWAKHTATCFKPLPLLYYKLWTDGFEKFGITVGCQWSWWSNQKKKIEISYGILKMENRFSYLSHNMWTQIYFNILSIQTHWRAWKKSLLFLSFFCMFLVRHMPYVNGIFVVECKSFHSPYSVGKLQVVYACMEWKKWFVWPMMNK